MTGPLVVDDFNDRKQVQCISVSSTGNFLINAACKSAAFFTNYWLGVRRFVEEGVYQRETFFRGTTVMQIARSELQVFVCIECVLISFRMQWTACQIFVFKLIVVRYIRSVAYQFFK